jgi:hypothetical protein
MMMTEIKPLVVRIPPELRAELEPIATTERRSLRNTICAALAEWLENRNDTIAQATRFAPRRPGLRYQVRADPRVRRGA